MQMADDSNVRSLRAEAFKKRLEKLAAQSAISDADFADTVYDAMAEFGISEDDFRDTFGMTKGAVERWITLKNLPQPVVRGKILSWIKDQLP